MRKSLRKAIASLLAVALIVGTWSNGAVTAYATEEGATPVAETQAQSIVVKVDDQTFTYDGEDHKASFSVTGANKKNDNFVEFEIGDKQYRFRVNIDKVTDVGTYTLTPSISDFKEKWLLGWADTDYPLSAISLQAGTVTVAPATQKVDFYVTNPDRGLFGSEFIEVGSGTITGQVVSAHDADGFWGNEIIRFGEFSKIGDNYTITYPASYPEIKVGKTTYTYDPAGNRANTYSIQWVNVKAVKEFMSEYSYHCNGTVVLQKENIYNVVFTVDQPGVGFTQVSAASLAEGSALTAPAVEESVEFNGSRYVFAGWYADAAFTTPANIATLSGDSNFYGKYVEAQTLTLVPAVENATYDGEKHVVNSFVTTQFGDVTVSGLSVYAEGVNAGSYNVAVEGTAVVTDANGNDVTKFYNVVVESAKLVIAKKDATIASLSASKQYDGTALTYAQYLMEGFVGNEVPEVVVTGTLTDIGTASNTFRVVYGAGINADNYNVKLVEGKLTVTAVEGLVVTFANATQTYNGNALVGTYSANMDLVKGHSFAIVAPSITNVGTVANTAAVKIVDAAGNDVTKYYANIQVVPGTLTVTTVEGLVVTFGNATKTYDGKALIGGYSANKDLVAGHSFDIVRASIIDAGTEVNTAEVKIVDAAGNDVTANYDVTVVPGTLTVTKRDAVIQTASETKTYDGTALTDNGYGIWPGGFVNGETPTVKVTGSQTDAGSSKNTIELVFPEGVKAENYNIITVLGTLTVNKSVIKVVSASDSKVYDGTALTNNEVTVTGTYANGETPEYVFAGTQTNAGDSLNAFEVVFPAGVNADNYEVTTEFGTLTVTKAPSPVIYMKKDVVVVYGQNLQGDLIDRIEGLVEGHELKINIDRPKDTTAKAVGTYANSFGTWGKATITCGDEDVTANYEKATTRRGSYVVVPASAPEVSFANAKARTYGDNLAADYTVNFVEEGYNDRYVLEVIDVPTYVPAGSYEFKVVDGKIVAVKDGQDAFAMDYVVYAANDESKADLKSNFASVAVSGTWEVAKRTVSITSFGSFKTYDGKALTVGTVDYTPFSGTAHFLDGEQPTYKVTGSQLNVGSSKNTFTYEFPAGVSADNYDVDVTYGTLTVNKRAVTVKSVDATRQYRVQPLTANEVVVTSELGFVDGDVAGYNFTGSQAEVGSSDNTFTVQFKDAETAANYDVTVEYGTLTVNPITGLVITFHDVQKEYDGTPISVPFEKLVTVGPMLIGHTIVFEETEVPTVVEVADSTDYTVSFKIMEGTKDVTEFYKDVTVNPGTFTITKREGAVVTFGTESKVYDGTALVGKVTATGLAEGQTLKVTTPSITDAGMLKNTAEFTVVDANGKDVTANYANIEVKEGVLVVKQREIVVTSDSDSKEYDGTPLTNDVVTVKGEYVEGEEPTYDFSGEVTEPGEVVDNTFTVVFPEGVNADNYAIKKIYGDLEVVKRTGAVVTFADQTRDYDGTPLVGEFTWNDAVLEGHKVVVEEPATITNKGEAVNVASFKVVDGEGNDVTEKYYDVIEVEEGTLTINPLKVTVEIVGDQVSVYYTGFELAAQGYDATYSSELYTDADFTFGGNAVVRATADASYPYVMGLAADQFENINENFDVTFVVTDGFLKIYYDENLSPAREGETPEGEEPEGEEPVIQPPVVEEPEEEEPVVEEPVVEEPVVEESEVVEEETTKPEVEVEVVEDATAPVVSDDLVEIEDEETPLANLNADGGNGPIFWILLAGLLATVALFVFFVILRKNREEEEEA